jgi:DNA replication protein DnaC
MKKIDEVAKKIEANISRVNTATSLSTKTRRKSEPEVCPICSGVGFLRVDLPVGDPNFGKKIPCECQKKTVTNAANQRMLEVSNMQAFSDLTFESFKTLGRTGLGEQQIRSLEFALNQSRLYAQNLKGWLLLQGSYGCGKTHLAVAIANFTLSLGIPTLILTVPDLLDWLRYAYDRTDTNFEDRFAEIRNIPLLVLDDLGTQNATPWAEEKLYQIINHRYMMKLPLVVTTNLDLAEIDGRIRSRLLDPDLVSTVRITAPDFRSPMQDSTQATISSLTLVNEHTFGNFSLRENEKLPSDEQKSLEKAFKASQQFAEKPHGWLVLSGTYGTGKTHLAAAIGNYRSAYGENPIFIVVPDLLDHLRSTFNPSSNVSYDHLFEEIRTASLLLLDDLGTQNSSPWAKEKLFQLLNYRYEARLPTVITTTCSLDEIDPRIRSRMVDARRCEIYAILTPSYRGRGSAGTRSHS